MKDIVLATNNEGKLKEIKEILKGYNVKSLKEENVDIEIEENKDTFEGNATKKATEIAKIIKKVCIADDSGLEIEMLEGFPGVKTARFLGENATQDERNKYIINKMKGIPKEKRKAKSITCIAISNSKGECKIFEGILEGYISESQRGKNGFGYDEIFELEDGRTLAELDSLEKNEISNRRIALNKLKEYLLENEM